MKTYKNIRSRRKWIGGQADHFCAVQNARKIHQAFAPGVDGRDGVILRRDEDAFNPGLSGVRLHKLDSTDIRLPPVPLPGLVFKESRRHSHQREEQRDAKQFSRE